MDITRLLNWIGWSIYLFQAWLAIWGIYNAILLYRGIGKRSLSDEDAGRLLDLVRERIRATGQVQPAVELCSGPPYWHSALAQLFGVALRNLGRGLARVKQVMVMEFHTRVISVMESRLASIVTASKLAPLLGLLGTVIGMIGAFGNVSQGQRAGDPGSQLAASIALGLWTTAVGLIIASPLLLVANDLQTRLRGLRDRTERQLQDFVEFLESLDTSSIRPVSPPSGPAGGQRVSAMPR